MSVWANFTSAPSAALRGSEGELVSISVTVEPRDLEELLEALATLEFPINPQIYHNAAVTYAGEDGERTEPATLVEFPAYEDRVPKIRRVLEACGFEDGAVAVAAMLDEIHGGERIEPAPPGAAYAHRVVRKRPPLTATARQ